jgi:hypothetical protein
MRVRSFLGAVIVSMTLMYSWAKGTDAPTSAMDHAAHPSAWKVLNSAGFVISALSFAAWTPPTIETIQHRGFLGATISTHTQRLVIDAACMSASARDADSSRRLNVTCLVASLASLAFLTMSGIATDIGDPFIIAQMARDALQIALCARRIVTNKK